MLVELPLEPDQNNAKNQAKMSVHHKKSICFVFVGEFGV